MLKPQFKLMDVLKTDGGNGSNGGGNPTIVARTTPVTNDPIKDGNDPAKPDPVVTGNNEPVVEFQIGDSVVKAGDEITIDNNVYTFDKSGNAIDKDGTIIMSKDDIIKQYTNSVSTNNNDLFNTVKTLTGIPVYDDNGTELIFDNTPEGIAKYNNALIEQTKKETRTSSINDFLESNPDIKDLYNHKQLFGSIDNYKADIDYSKIDVTKLDSDAKKRFFISAELAKGTSKEYAEEIWNAIKANKSEDKITKESIKHLDKIQSDEKQNRINSIKLQEQANNERLAKMYGYSFNDKGDIIPLNIENSYYDLIVKKGVIGNVKIPEAGITYKDDKGTAINLSRTDLLELVSTTHHDGKDYDKAGRSYGKIILDEYLSNPINHINMILTLLTKKGFSGIIESTNKTNKINLTTTKNKPGTGDNSFKLPVTN